MRHCVWSIHRANKSEAQPDDDDKKYKTGWIWISKLGGHLRVLLYSYNARIGLFTFASPTSNVALLQPLVLPPPCSRDNKPWRDCHRQQEGRL